MARKPRTLDPEVLARKRYLTGREVEASGLYPYTNSTLEKWRCAGTGPAFVKLSPRKVVYDRQALDAYLAQCATGGGAAP